ncbi:hypothetical protein [Sphingomonas sp.]|uniref:hypothetical protein n=1 Tax=Sphingomonas sp. TaxID=28214 RepID=UPI003F703B21
MIALPDSPSGADLVAAIRAAAQASGVAIYQFARPLSRYPASWLDQTGKAASPKPQTIERVHALLKGEPVPPPPANNFQSPRSAAIDREALEAADRRAQARRLTTRHPLPLDRPQPTPVIAIDIDRRPQAMSREPCFRCQVRGDLGCAHQLPFDPAAH